MENIKTWKKVHLVIAEQLKKHTKQMQEHRCGLSQESMIVNALKEVGFLTEKAFEEIEKKPPQTYIIDLETALKKE